MSNQLKATGQAIRELRKSLGIQQKDLAASINITASHLSRVETGERVASERLTTAVLRQLGVDAL